MKRQTVNRALPEALKVIKGMNLTSQEEWAGDYRDAARDTIARETSCSPPGVPEKPS